MYGFYIHFCGICSTISIYVIWNYAVLCPLLGELIFESLVVHKVALSLIKHVRKLCMDLKGNETQLLNMIQMEVFCDRNRILVIWPLIMWFSWNHNGKPNWSLWFGKCHTNILHIFMYIVSCFINICENKS